jgi:Ion transport protein
MTSDHSSGKDSINMSGEVKEYSDVSMRNKYLLQQNKLFHPLKTWRVRWDFLFAFVIILSTSYLPYKLAFFQDVNVVFDIVFESLCTVVFCSDMIIQFNTAIFDDDSGALIVDRTRIAIHYLQLWFWVDLLSSFPFDLIVSAINTATDKNSLYLLALIRILRFVKLIRLNRLTAHTEKLRYFGIISVFIEMLFVGHTVACFWYFYGSTVSDRQTSLGVESVYPHSWVEEYISVDQGTYDKYVAAFYWTLFTMCGIGYGDIHPVSSG